MYSIRLKNGAKISLTILGFLCSTLYAYAQNTPPSLTIIANDAAHATIVVGSAQSDISMQAAREFQQGLFESTSVRVPILHNVNAVPKGNALIIIGAGSEARAHGVDEESLAPEAFRIKITPEYMVLVGHGIKAAGGSVATVSMSRATQWSVDYLLDRFVGILWLWPGPLGTYTPKHDEIAFPAMDITLRPSMDMRYLSARIGGVWRYHSDVHLDKNESRKLQEELDLWRSRHELGGRAPLQFGSAFGEWWVKYHRQHPDYFAQPPAGLRQPEPNPRQVKLRLGNPAVARQIIANWRAAGRPDNWNVCPNDGFGFDTSQASRAMDYPPDQSPLKIWKGTANLTIRYIKFWNNLLEQMKKENPKVQLDTYAYSAYRDLPKPTTVQSGLNVEFVNGYNASARKQWILWSQSGANLYLRPNWWWVGGPAPFLPLHQSGNYFKFAMAHGMKGFFFDRLMGYWATQGPYYYLMARLSERPDLSVDDVINEYASAFGDAAPEIINYLHYWEQLSDKIAYSVPAGGSVAQDTNGLYSRLARRRAKFRGAMGGSWRSIPYFYNVKVISEAEKILDHAQKLTVHGSGKVKARIKFLYDGLRYLQAVSNVMTEKPFDKGIEAHVEGAKSLQEYQLYLTKMGVLWGSLASKQIHRFARH